MLPVRVRTMSPGISTVKRASARRAEGYDGKPPVSSRTDPIVATSRAGMAKASRRLRGDASQRRLLARLPH